MQNLKIQAWTSGLLGVLIVWQLWGIFELTVAKKVLERLYKENAKAKKSASQTKSKIKSSFSKSKIKSSSSKQSLSHDWGNIPKGWPLLLWKKCWKQRYVDFTHPQWLRLSPQMQGRYSAAYKRWYADFNKLRFRFFEELLG